MITLTNIDARLEDSRAPTVGGYIQPLLLTPKYGYVPQRLNKGFPAVREVAENRPSQNGTFDFTEFFGARGVTLEIALAAELQDDPAVTDEILEDKLRRWMNPSLRTYLYFRRSLSVPFRRILLRSTNLSSQWSFLSNSDFQTVSMSWKGIDGVFEGELQTEILGSGVSIELGRSYDLIYDRSYASSAIIGSKILVNYGNAPSYPVITIFGPCAQPRVENRTTGLKFEFLSSFSLLDGEYLVIDFKEGTVSMSGDVDNPRYDKVDFTMTKWWTLEPGNNEVRYYPLNFSFPSQALVEWRSNYI